MKIRSYDEWQGYDQDQSELYGGGQAETLPLSDKPRIKIITRYRQRLHKPKAIRGFVG